MATLFNTKISATYEGLLKTIDNAAISATLRELTDGSGNQSGLFLNTLGDFKVTSVLEWGSLKDTGTGVIITQFVTAANGIENFNNDTTLPTSAAVKLYVDTKFSQTDTLTEVLGFGNTTSGKDIAVSAGDDITFTDTSKALFGTGSEFEIFQDAFDSRITTSSKLYIQTTDFRLQKVGGEQMIEAYSDGEVKLYFNNIKKFETTLLGSTVTGDLLVTGTITGAGGSFLPLAGGTMTGNTIHVDNVKSIYGTSSDGLEIYHDGSNSYIDDSGNGRLNIRTNDLRIEKYTGETIAKFIADGAVELNFNDVKKLETTNTGASVTGALSTTTDVAVGANATFVDNGKAIFGSGSDLQIYHDGSNSSIQNQNGELFIYGGTNQIRLRAENSEESLVLNPNSNVELYFDGTKRIETVTDGAKVTGNLEVTGTITGAGGSFLPLIGGTMTGDISLVDNVKVKFGDSSDLQIFHDGSNSYINDIGSGDLILTSNSSSVQINKSTGVNLAKFIVDGSVELYHNSTKKFETTTTGISVTGNVDATGNVSVLDNKFLYAGTAQDLSLWHDGNDTRIKNNTGGLYIDQAAVTESIIFRVSNANALDTTALTINREGDLITGKDVTIAGDLTVNGTTTTVNSQTLSVEDPLISLATANAANSLDIGFYGKYNDGTARYLGLFNDASDSNKFRLFKGTTVEPTTTVNIGGAGYVAADLVVAGLEATNVVSTDLLLGSGEYLSWGSEGVTSIEGSTVSNKLSFRTQSAERLLLNANGATFSANVTVGNTLFATEFISHLADTNNFIRFQASRMTLQNKASGGVKVDLHDNGNLYLVSGGSTSLILDTSQKATFAGDVSVNGGDLNVGSTSTVNSLINMLGTDDSFIEKDQGNDLYLVNNNNGKDLKFRVRNASGTNIVALTLDGSAGGNATFAGKLGVGTASGVSQLEVDGDIGIGRIAGGYTFREQVGGNLRAAMRSNALNELIFEVGASTQALKLDSSQNATFAGNVLIDGFTNNKFLSLRNSACCSVPSSTGGIGLMALDHTGANRDGLALYGHDGVSIYTAQEERMRLTNLGNVGIGTTAPSQKLTINGNGAFLAGNELRFYNAANSNWGQIESPASGALQFSSGGGVAMYITSSKNVGIGTVSPTFKLHVNSTDASDNVAFIHHNSAAQSSGDVLKVRSDAGDNAGSALLNVQNNSGTALYVRGNRKVGIGTIAPDETLDVDGTFKASGLGYVLTPDYGDDSTKIATTAFVKSNAPVQATTTVKGIVELATQAEVNSGSDASRVITPSRLKSTLGITGTLSTTLTYSQLVGGATSQIITHAIGNQFVQVSVYEVAGMDKVECEVELTSATTTTLKFNVAPAADSLRVVIVG